MQTNSLKGKSIGAVAAVQELGADMAKFGLSGTATNLVASAVVSPIYVFVTNPLSRLEVIMQTNSLKGNSISTVAALKELSTDMAKFGLAGIFRGQGIGIAKAIVSLTLFHEGRMWLTTKLKERNVANGWVPKDTKK